MITFPNALSRSVIVLIAAAALCACTAGAKHAVVASEARDGEASERMMVRTGELTVSVDDPEEAGRMLEHIVKDAGGYVERSNARGESRVWARCRVPTDDLDRVMEAVAALGDETNRSVSAADATDQYTDLEARIRNNVALRDRLALLLDKADDVSDVLAVEKELTRVQSEIESMQARFDRLKSEIELSVLTVTLERERILGPLGYIGYGVWWAFSKLFIVR